ncbi:CBS domain protein [Burkholderia multivorans ATCC BAA-247]|uniref:CBS domain containing protein n=2 Tax=Burkholderia multivorans TaxID=87883 RepID=B9BID8_9BURK|nr:CBS domain containing protein [Burkholderia multivorans CGD2]EEE15391.1 CBS domain containing protein [Burkholderia multivorans CGD2M]EJO52529.1 CBS domain protein [Burkholderia multivorans ATCC BAA-247]
MQPARTVLVCPFSRPDPKEAFMYRVNEIMSRDVVCVAPTDTIRHAAELMQRFDIGVLPVCDHGELVAIVTDRDIAVRALAHGRSPDTPVRAVASEPVQWCTEDEGVGDVQQRMADVQLHRMPVLDRHRRVVGIVSLGDIATRAGGPARDELVNTLEDVSLPRRH